LRTYVEMLKFQDQLHSHAYFHKAAAGAIRWISCLLLVCSFNAWVVMLGSVCNSLDKWACTCMGAEIPAQIHTRSNVYRESELVIVIRIFFSFVVSNILCFTVLLRLRVFLKDCNDCSTFSIS
jgi:hypothetical protein